MARVVTAVVWPLLVVLVGAAAAQKPAVPKTAPPDLVVVEKVNKAKGTFTVRSFEKDIKLSEVVKEVTQGGMKVQVKEMKAEIVDKAVVTEVSLRVVGVTDTAGKEVKGEALWKRLAPGAVLARQIGKEKVDP